MYGSARREELSEEVCAEVSPDAEELVQRQKSISDSLLAFLEQDDSELIVTRIFRSVLEQFRGSRVYLFELDWVAGIQTCVYEVTADGVSTEKNNLQRLPMSDSPWWMEQLSRHRRFCSTTSSATSRPMRPPNGRRSRRRGSSRCWWFRS